MHVKDTLVFGLESDKAQGETVRFRNTLTTRQVYDLAKTRMQLEALSIGNKEETYIKEVKHKLNQRTKNTKQHQTGTSCAVSSLTSTNKITKAATDEVVTTSIKTNSQPCLHSADTAEKLNTTFACT